MRSEGLVLIVRSVKLFMLAALAAVLGACIAPTPTPMKTSSPTVTLIPSTTATATNTLTATETPSPTPSASPTGPYTPAAVMRLEDAKSEALSWLDPERSPRIEAAYYVTEGQMHQAGLSDEEYFVYALGPMLGTPFPVGESPHLMVVVVASTQGIDMLDADGQRDGQPRTLVNEDNEWPNGCYPVRASRRQSVVGIFDAATGVRLSDGPVTSSDTTEQLASLARRGRTRLPGATSLATATTMPTRTPYPSAEASPTPPVDITNLQQLGDGEVPTALAAAVSELPLVKGSQWVYRYATQQNGVQWTRHTVTRTIDAAWKVAPDAMLVRESQQVSAGGDLPFYNPPIRYLFVYPEGVVEDQGRATVAEVRGVLAAPIATPSQGTRSEPSLGHVLRLPLQTSDVPSSYQFSVLRQAPVAVPAGAFGECIVESEILGAAAWAERWVCPGAGTVLYQMAGCYNLVGKSEKMELLNYAVPPIRSVEEDLTPPVTSQPVGP